MKKITLLLLCMIGISAAAQVTFKPGIRAGVNFSSISDANADMRQDFYVGGFGAIKFTRFYTLQPELTYARQGADNADMYMYDSNAGMDVVYKKDIEIQYFSVGVINKITLSNSFNIHAGASLDFETGSNINSYNEADFSLTAGLGYTLPFGLTIEARVKQGVIDVLESEDDFFYIYSNDDNRNFSLQLGLSYAFDFKATGATN
jgi:hypothetical protein